jgi:hypothetical protein
MYRLKLHGRYLRPAYTSVPLIWHHRTDDDQPEHAQHEQDQEQAIGATARLGGRVDVDGREQKCPVELLGGRVVLG